MNKILAGALILGMLAACATDPAKAAEGTIRKIYARSVGENSVHGSDSPASADREIALNFRLDEIVG